jgi:hypothetical protein
VDIRLKVQKLKKKTCYENNKGSRNCYSFIFIKISFYESIYLKHYREYKKNRFFKRVLKCWPERPFQFESNLNEFYKHIIELNMRAIWWKHVFWDFYFLEILEHKLLNAYTYKFCKIDIKREVCMILFFFFKSELVL